MMAKNVTIPCVLLIVAIALGFSNASVFKRTVSQVLANKNRVAVPNFSAVAKRRLELTSNIVPMGWGTSGRHVTKEEENYMNCIKVAAERNLSDEQCKDPTVAELFSDMPEEGSR